MQAGVCKMNVLQLSNVVFSPDWEVFKEYFSEEREKVVRSLILSTSQDESMRFRGEIKRLESLLKLSETLQEVRKAKR
jgi:hypothetical protein